MANVACIMMQKNEDDLLDIWIRYHEAQFGSENIFIFDNGSTSQIVMDVLEKAERRGVVVDRTRNSSSDFERKGEIISEKIRNLEGLNKYDFFMPLDCDEFVAVFDDNESLSVKKDDIHNYLEEIMNLPDVLMIGGEYLNFPKSYNTYYFLHNRKCFFSSNSFGSLDIGFHWGKSRLSDAEFRTRIIHFHFQNKPFDTLLLHAKEKLKLRVDNFDREFLASYDGPGFHLARYFLMTEDEYISGFDRYSERITTDVFNALLKDNSCSVPFFPE